MAAITDIADAVVAELNGHTFSQPLTAARHYRPLFDLKDMAALHVSVVPKGASAERLDRSRHQEEYQVDVAVQKKVEALDNATLDPLAGLVEEIGLFLRDRRLASYPAAVWLRTENVPIYAPEHLDELRQFTSVLTLTFRVVR
jgi:hypothetical protein